MLNPLAANRPDLHYVWRGPAQLAIDHDGRAGTLPLSGFFFRQNRFLRELQLELNGESPFRCSLAETAANELELTYIFPPLTSGDGGGSGSGAKGSHLGLLYRDVTLRLTYRVHPASLEAVLLVTNHWQEEVALDVAWRLSADYATTDEAHFNQRRQIAAVDAEPIENGVCFRYRHPELPFETRVVGSGARWHFERERLSTRLHLTRQQTARLRLDVRAVDYEDPIDSEGACAREGRLIEFQNASWKLYATGETPLIEMTERAGADLAALAMLEGPADEWLTPAAGVPLYQTMWGRDACTTAWQAGIMDGGLMLRDVVARCARLQGTVVDADRDEEPGRIINQAKLDALSRLGDQTFRRYYADVASPFMFIIALGYYYARSGDRSTVERHWDAAKRVLDWARVYGDRDGDGYIEYLTRSAHGPTHQGWKDSENAVVYEDGTHVKPPIAPCEIQGYYYASLQFMAVLAAVQHDLGNARTWWQQAADLKERFNRDFWLEDEGFIAFGLDAGKRQIRALTPTQGSVFPQASSALSTSLDWFEGCSSRTCSVAGAFARFPRTIRPITRWIITWVRSGQSKTAASCSGCADMG
ncbi:MAG: glycogen debranching N-terminal domain-containing protein [Gemmatimonadota bacterium]